MKQSAIDRIKTRKEYEEAVKLNRAIVGQRQAAEWGMRALQETFARIKSILPSEDMEREGI